MTEKEIVSVLREITARGNSAEVKKNADGSLTVYEVKKKKVTSGK